MAKVIQNEAKRVLVMNIERQFFAAILAKPRRKDIEYRALSEYWLRRLAKVGPAPFTLRLLNGMLRPVPEATVRITRVVRDTRAKELRFYIGRVLSVKNWNRELEAPIRRPKVGAKSGAKRRRRA